MITYKSYYSSKFLDLINLKRNNLYENTFVIEKLSAHLFDNNLFNVKFLDKLLEICNSYKIQSELYLLRYEIQKNNVLQDYTVENISNLIGNKIKFKVFQTSKKISKFFEKTKKSKKFEFKNKGNLVKMVII